LTDASDGGRDGAGGEAHAAARLAMLSERKAEIARLLAVMGQPARLRILVLLLDGPMNAGWLMTELERSRPRVSMDLAILRATGLVTSKRIGKFVWYRLADERVQKIIMVALGAGGLPSTSDASGLVTDEGRSQNMGAP
jgi:DNA-binding transcriptional ArsR family regulator